jgi:hypothetical protein
LTLPKKLIRCGLIHHSVTVFSGNLAMFLAQYEEQRPYVVIISISFTILCPVQNLKRNVILTFCVPLCREMSVSFIRH